MALNREFERIEAFIEAPADQSPVAAVPCALFGELAAANEEALPLEEVPETLLEKWAKRLGISALVEVLRSGESVGTPSAHDEKEDTIAMMVALCKPPRGALWSLIEEAGALLLPACLGPAEVDPRVPSSIFATRLGGEMSVTWRSDVFSSGAKTEYQWTSPTGDNDLLTKKAIRFEGGFFHIDPATYPADGQWRMFCLSAGDVESTMIDEREVLLLCRDPGPLPLRGGPAGLIQRGYLIDGWHSALRENWDEPALRCLLVLLFAKMDLLMTQTARDILFASPDHEFLRSDFEALSANRIAPLKQGLLEGLPGA